MPQRPSPRWLWILAAALAGPVALHAQPAPKPDAAAPALDPARLAKLGALLDDAAVTQRLVGISAAIATGDGDLATIHRGLADREREIPADDRTMYRWASISKPLTAVLTMQVWRQGSLDLDADVRTYVPEFPDPGKRITARQLLTHQGGIVHYSNGPVVPTRRAYESPHPFKDLIVALDTFNRSPLVCEPGSKHAYTTHGYILLGAVAQRAAGKDADYADLVAQRIARPLGLTTLRPDYQWEEIPHRAVGYRKRPAPKPAGDAAPADRPAPPAPDEIIRSTDTDVSWKLPGGGWISTVGDLARFGAGLLGDVLLDGPTRALMWTAQPTADGTPTQYGLGFAVGRFEGRAAVSHSGAQEKTSTFLLILPEHPGGGIAVAVMTNTEGASLGALARRLATEWVAGAPKPPAPAR